jgi:hypothetical protein
MKFQHRFHPDPELDRIARDAVANELRSREITYESWVERMRAAAPEGSAKLPKKWVRGLKALSGLWIIPADIDPSSMDSLDIIFKIPPKDPLFRAILERLEALLDQTKAEIEALGKDAPEAP